MKRDMFLDRKPLRNPYECYLNMKKNKQSFWCERDTLNKLNLTHRHDRFSSVNVNIKPYRKQRSTNLEVNLIMLTRTGQSKGGFGVCTEIGKMNSRFISVDNTGKLAIFGTIL